MSPGGRLRELLARAWLLTAAVTAPSACLVTSPPEYEAPQQTPPFLVASEAFPDLRQVLVIDDEKFVEFGGAVISEDSGAPVEIALYIDYGQPNAASQPFRRAIRNFASIPPGSVDDGPRKFQGIRWYLDVDGISPGCHTITMMATHDFDYTSCPKALADSSHLVWQVIACDPNGGPCPSTCGPTQCAEQQCPSCPAVAGADGGAP